MKLQFLKAVSFLSLVSIIASAQATPVTDWKQPPVGCVEELYPKLASESECADPGTLSAEMRVLCEQRTAVLAEIANPGVQLPMSQWLSLHILIDRDQKIDWINEAARKYGMPPQFLYGVANLETMVTDLGVIRDGGNFSCGTGSLNIWQWCRWMNTLPRDFQSELGWPVGIKCQENVLPPSLVETIFDKADFSRSSTVPMKPGMEDWQIQLHPIEANAVSDATILDGIRESYHDVGHLKSDVDKLQAIRSFTRNCSNPRLAIPAIAYSLRDIFDRLVPGKVKNLQRYSKDETFSRNCKYPYPSKFYPLHPGWLLAYGIHNQGEDLGEAYRRSGIFRRNHRDGSYTPAQLEEDLISVGGRRATVNIRGVAKRMMLEGYDPYP